MMWKLLVPLVLRSASALPATWNGTVTCPHDALYTSLVGDGGDFCSSVMEAHHCGGGYSTPSQFVAVNQTRIASYCECIMTNSNVTATPAASGIWTSGGPTATTHDSMSGTSDQASTETSEPPAGRPGPGPPSDSSSGSSMPASTAPESVTGSDGTGTTAGLNASVTEITTVVSSSGGSLTSISSFNSSAASIYTNTSSSDESHTSGTAPDTPATVSFTDASGRGASRTSSDSSAGSLTESQVPGAESSRFPNVTTSLGPQNPTTSGFNSTVTSSVSETDQPRPGPWRGNSTSELPGNSTTSLSFTSGRLSSIVSGWNSSRTLTNAPSSRFGSITGSGVIGTGTIGTVTGLPRPSGNSTLSASNSTISGSGSRTDSGTDLGATSTGIPPPGGNSTSPTSGNSISRAGSTTGSQTATPTSGANSPSLTLGSPSSGNFSVASTPTFITPTPFPNATSSHTANETSSRPSEFSAANFTRVTRTAAVSQETCYTLARDPEGDTMRRALLHNSKLREENASIPLPYIESVDFESGGVDPLYVTIRDIDQGSHSIDISNKSQIAIVDSFGNSMLLDEHGIHFSTNSCTYSVSINIKDMYQQLADLAGVQCSTSGPEKRMENMDFTQVLNLQDQCGDPVGKSLRPYPQLLVGDTSCVDIMVDENTGQWEFDCTFPGSQSGSMKCESAIKNDIVDFLLVDPFGGACPDISTVITTLEATGQDFINPESLRTELYNQGLDSAEMVEADTAITQYSQLWEVLQQSFSKSRTQPPRNTSALEAYIDLYNTYRSFEDDICEDLHAGEIPLKLSLTAGSTRIDAITTLNWAPESPRPYNLTVQDSSKIACCANGTVADVDGDTCAYPNNAVLTGTGCICGQTMGGLSLAFEETECDNYVSKCESDAGCKDYPGFVCLTGSCCGVGVCVDPYACSQNGTVLVKF